MNSQRTLALLAVALLTGPMAAHAVTLQINGDGILTGALDVKVGGALYNVQFLDGACISLFTGCDNATDDFAFTTLADALIAAQVLLDHVWVDTTLGEFDSHPELTNGCGGFGLCIAISPYTIFVNGEPGIRMVGVTNFISADGDLSPGEFSFSFPPDFDSNNPFITYFVWSLASIPEPGTLALLGLGLLGLAVVRGRAA